MRSLTSGRWKVASCISTSWAIAAGSSARRLATKLSLSMIGERRGFSAREWATLRCRGRSEAAPVSEARSFAEEPKSARGRMIS